MKKKYFAYIIILLPFLPFLSRSFGLRFIHIFIYGLGSVILPCALLFGKIRLQKQLTTFAGLLLFFLFWSSAIAYGMGDINWTSFLANFESYLQPVFVIGLVYYAIQNYGYEQTKNLLIKCMVLLICLLGLNAIIAISQIFFDLRNILVYYQPVIESGERTTWESSLSMARFLGVFGAPSQAGITYSFGLICYAYLYINSIYRSWLLNILGLLVAIGGVITISKGFIVLLPFILLIYLLGNLKKVEVYKQLLLAIITLAILSSLSVYYSGTERITSILFGQGDDQNLIVRTLDTRYDPDGGSVTKGFSKLLEESPMLGFGMDYAGIVDSEYLRVSMYGGLVGLILLILMYATLYKTHYLSNQKGSESLLIRILLLFIFLASFGTPVITRDIFSPLFFVIFTITVHFLSVKSK